MDNNTSSGGVGLFTVIVIVLAILKLTGLIDISWWLVFLPWFIGFGLGIIILLVVLFIALFANRM